MSWKEDMEKLQRDAAQAGPVPLMPEQQERSKECDNEVTKVCEKHGCVPVVVETTTKMNGQPVMVKTQVIFLPKEMMQNPPEQG